MTKKQSREVIADHHAMPRKRRHFSFSMQTCRAQRKSGILIN